MRSPRQPAGNHDDEGYQKHQDGNAVDAVHHAEVDIARSGFVPFKNPQEVGEKGAKLKIVF